ncbi:unnamed protein product [Linum tenue]|uniref:Uncharacterized protein n=1 Tax=Linum tenue TaxID=586396 RepID=A0AAV0IE65_9ROSI|nr:unnamed protein product [Linum tenue]
MGSSQRLVIMFTAAVLCWSLLVVSPTANGRRLPQAPATSMDHKGNIMGSTALLPAQDDAPPPPPPPSYCIWYPTTGQGFAHRTPTRIASSRRHDDDLIQSIYLQFVFEMSMELLYQRIKVLPISSL